MNTMKNTLPPNDTAASGNAPSCPTMALSNNCTADTPTCDSITGAASRNVFLYCSLYKASCIIVSIFEKGLQR